MIQHINLEEYLNKTDFSDIPNDFSDEVKAARSAMPFEKQMLDAWAEADGALNEWKACKNSLTEDAVDEIEDFLSQLHVICVFLYNSDLINIYEKRTLKFAEWELNDFLLGTNRFHHTEYTIMTWFNQWL